MSVPGMLPPAAWGDAGGSSTLIQTLQSLGLTSGLQLCLDAGDASSYSGSGQTWSDVSGNGNDFYRGTSSSSQSSDPTFNGAAGAGDSSDYWSFDGGDYFTLVAGTNPTWVNNIHKAGQTSTLAMWVYLPTNAVYQGLMGTADSGSPGFVLAVSPGLSYVLENGSGSSSSGNAIVYTSAWYFGAATITNTDGAATVFQRNETSLTSYLMSVPFTPSSAAAPLPLRIGWGGGSYSGTLNKVQSGSRIGAAMIWQGVGLTGTQLTAIYNATKSRYGL